MDGVVLLLTVFVLLFYFLCILAGAVGDNEGVVLAFCAASVLVLLCLILGGILTQNRVKEGCETSLPRDQVCVIIAVPKDIEEK